MARVLLINDEPDLIEICEIVLEKNGHEVRHTLAPHRVRELASLVRWGPDLVLIDLVMPATSGEEVIARLRHMPRMAHVPIVVMSALPDAAERALEIGADGLLEKPFDPHALIEAVARAIDDGRTPRSRRHAAAPQSARPDSQR
jgi:CheY-like chemotaxis protein